MGMPVDDNSYMTQFDAAHDDDTRPFFMIYMYTTHCARAKGLPRPWIIIIII